ncbi:MAG: cytochrome c3 family protein [Sandaracinaceae bacterium]
MHAALGLLVLGCGHEASPAASDAPASPLEVVLVPRIPHLAAYPCGAQCHDAREPDAAPRDLAMFHSGRELEHGPAVRWCDDCHSIEEPDRLRLRSGELVSFDDSDRVCGQCHGEKHRDWRDGIHGLSTGGWRGTVRRRTCTACHEPHAPEPIWLEALPPPEPDPRVSEPSRPEGRER